MLNEKESVFPLKENGLPQSLCSFAMTGKRKYICTPYIFAIAKRFVILSDVASACGAGKSEQKEAPRSKVVRAPSE